METLDPAYGYALKKLSVDGASIFKKVDIFNSSVVGLIDFYAALPGLRRNFVEVRVFLDQALSDRAVNELEKNLFDDKFITPTLPSIENLRWIPTKENLDKIYDIEVAFVAKDDKTPISYAELRFIPIEYFYMIQRYSMGRDAYNLVFPDEDERVFVLKPKDGVFDELEEEFKASIENIIGGREYNIVALCKDQAGNTITKNLTTPYIRQFENLGKQLYEKGVKVGIVYGLITEQHTWDDYLKLGGPYKPLLGYYVPNSTEDLMVIEKHIDWMSGHGINFIINIWSGKESEGEIFGIKFSKRLSQH